MASLLSTSASLPLPSAVKALVRPNILALEPYRCARDDYEEGVLLDANENSFGPPLAAAERPVFGTGQVTEAAEAAEAAGVDLERYPDPHQAKLKVLLAALRGTRAGAGPVRRWAAARSGPASGREGT